MMILDAFEKKVLILIVLIISSGIFFVGCQLAPTKIAETQRREFDVIADRVTKPIVISENTVVLDSRSAFDYGLNHVSGAVHFTYEKFLEDSKSGQFMRDQKKLAARLALNGLEPKTSVVVVGYGPKDGMQEARIAWTLLYLGFKDVQVGSVDLFRSNWTSNASALVQNVKPWILSPHFEMKVGGGEFQSLLRDVRGRAEKKVFILDVRNESEYLRDKSKTVDVGIMNVPLNDFFTDLGRPNINVRKRLEALGVSRGSRIILDSGRDGRAEAAAYALLALGFTKIQTL